MKKRRPYKSLDVENFVVGDELEDLQDGCLIGIDVAKHKNMAAFGTAKGDIKRIVRFEHPRQTWEFVRIVEELVKNDVEVSCLMEPTGTYGDPVRYQVKQHGARVFKMNPKKTHDSRALIDNVPSLHDAKAATLLVTLHARLNHGEEWVPRTQEERETRSLVKTSSLYTSTREVLYGHLEAFLAEHWPELGCVVDVRVHRFWFALLNAYKSPAAVAADPEGAEKVMIEASRNNLSREKIEQIIKDAGQTTAEPMLPCDELALGRLLGELERVEDMIKQLDAEQKKVVSNIPEARNMASLVGVACAAAIISYVGLPSNYESATAFMKAMGLNLREKSSGEKRGPLSITKRGPRIVRQLLYLAALRQINRDPLTKAWYQNRGAWKAGLKKKAVVAVMRKLARALWHVSRGQPYDPQKLYDVRKLAKVLKPPRANNEAQPPGAAKPDRKRRNADGEYEQVAVG